VIALYLILSLALPLYAMLSKSMTTYRFNLDAFEVQVNAGTGWQPAQRVSACLLMALLDPANRPELDTNTDGRLAVVDSFPATVSGEPSSTASGMRQPMLFTLRAPCASPHGMARIHVERFPQGDDAARGKPWS
jgi:hypothetical protein